MLASAPARQSSARDTLADVSSVTAATSGAASGNTPMAIHSMCLRCCKMVWPAFVITAAATVILEKDRAEELR